MTDQVAGKSDEQLICPDCREAGRSASECAAAISTDDIEAAIRSTLLHLQDKCLCLRDNDCRAAARTHAEFALALWERADLTMTPLTPEAS